MKKQSSYIVSIPTPCHESWDAMSPADKGRFCQSCQKTVTDFSGMSDQQILSFLSNRQGNVCGRFHTEQLNREISVPGNARRQPLISIAAMAAALAIAIPSVQAKNKVEKIQLTPEQSNTIPQQTDTIPYITGIVIDSTDKTILPGALITLKGQKISTYADTTGKFNLQIPLSYREKTVILEVRTLGYLPKEFTVSLTNDVNYVEFPMHGIRKRSVSMGAVVTITTADLVSQKRTPWQRFKYNVGQLFR